MGAGMPALLSACGSSGTKTTSASAPKAGAPPAAGSLGAVVLQLSWIKNAEYIADTKGYYSAAGLKGMTLLSGGPSVAQDSIVAAGKAFVGISSPDITAPPSSRAPPS